MSPKITTIYCVRLISEPGNSKFSIEKIEFGGGTECSAIYSQNLSHVHLVDASSIGYLLYKLLASFVILRQFIEDLSNSLEVLAFTPSLKVQAIAQARSTGLLTSPSSSLMLRFAKNS